MECRLQALLLNITPKVKVCQWPIWRHMSIWRYSSSNYNRQAEWSALRPAALPSGGKTCYPPNRRQLGSRVGLDDFGGQINPLPLAGIDQLFRGPAACSLVAIPNVAISSAYTVFAIALSRSCSNTWITVFLCWQNETPIYVCKHHHVYLSWVRLWVEG
jgi:hypothetical protein